MWRHFMGYFMRHDITLRRGQRGARINARQVIRVSSPLLEPDGRRVRPRVYCVIRQSRHPLGHAASR